ncbi:YihY family inner membrane protein [Flavobacteriaceae bacterium Ap0902]|nr:YihY family inner membrane protein [Flavobacteriaceae bacterium Ap0902]
MGFKETFQNLKAVQKTTDFLKNIQIPTLEDTNLYVLIKIYFASLIEGAITTRASAISWSLFLSLFPFLLFVYSWIPYLPNYDNIEGMMYSYLVNRIFPQNDAVQIESVVSIIARKTSNSWFTIILAVFFATNGVNSLMNGFSDTANRIAGVKNRNIIQQYIVSLIFTVFSTAFLLFFLWLLNYVNSTGQEMLEIMLESNLMIIWVKRFMFFGLAFLFFLTAVCLLYFYGFSFDGRFRKMVPGAILTTILFFLLALGFSFYIENFNNYNLLYGSISTLLIVMLFIYITVFIILLGFELNMTLLYAKDRKDILIKELDLEP